MIDWFKKFWNRGDHEKALIIAIGVVSWIAFGAGMAAAFGKTAALVCLVIPAVGTLVGTLVYVMARALLC